MKNSSNNVGSTGEVASQLGTALITTVISGMYAKGEGKKARKLEKELTELSLEKQIELEHRLQDVQSETERQGMLFQFLIVQKNNELIDKSNSKKYTSYVVLGIGATILSLVIVRLAKK